MKNFNQIYKENHKTILRFIVSKIHNIETAQELANDVFLRIHNNLDKYDETISSFRTWIMNITNNVVIDHWRKNKMETISITATVNNQSEDESSLDVLAFYGKVYTDTPETSMINKESLSNFRNIVDRLPERYYRIANLFFNKQLSYEEIAKTLDIPLGTVKGQLFRVREMLEKENLVMR